ncbi:MAG: hypothetical protein ACNYWU_08655 [Desulfobacterales bacterium]
MSWNVYRLVYQAMSPIHIGWHTLGYIKLTRHYIPGKNIWGAMTANLTRTCGAEGIDGYKEFGDLLKTKIRTSCFYPALDPDKPLLPHFKEKGLCYGSYTVEEFERRFIGSFGQTAILPESNTAEDESLHESEYISHSINENGKCKPVSFVGYICIKKDAALKDGRKVGWSTGDVCLMPANRELFVGGDIKYGWGRLKLQNNPEDEGWQKKMFGYEFVSNRKSQPCIKIPKGSPLMAHLKVESGLKIKGDIEPFVGREWRSVKNSKKKTRTGAGQEISSAGVCWVPGSVIEEETKPLRIGEFGILTKGD